MIEAEAGERMLVSQPGNPPWSRVLQLSLSMCDESLAVVLWRTGNEELLLRSMGRRDKQMVSRDEVPRSHSGPFLAI